MERDGLSADGAAMDVVLVTGTVGVGKTSVGYALAATVATAAAPAGFLDLDGLSRRWPAPADDPFRESLTLANLRSVLPNLAGDGVVRLVLAWAVETRADVDAVADAVGRPISVVRLIAPDEVVAERLRGRHVGIEADGLDWHLARAPELDRALDRSGIDALLVEASGSVGSVVGEVRRHLAW